jgi:hypothetical protein
MAREALILYGEKELSWRRFIGVLFIAHEQILGARNTWVIPYVMNIFPSNTPRFQLLDLLYRTRSCQSSDPRDKVFAVVPMSEPVIG